MRRASSACRAVPVFEHVAQVPAQRGWRHAERLGGVLHALTLGNMPGDGGFRAGQAIQRAKCADQRGALIE